MGKINREASPYKRATTIDVKLAKGKGVGDFIIARIAEFLGTDELVDAINNRNEAVYLHLWEELIRKPTWVVSFADYVNFIKYLRLTLPKRYKKIDFDIAASAIISMYGPITFEEGEKLDKSKVALNPEDDEQEAKEDGADAGEVQSEATESK